jgi:hypothetical protein
LPINELWAKEIVTRRVFLRNLPFFKPFQKQRFIALSSKALSRLKFPMVIFLFLQGKFPCPKNNPQPN